MEAAEPRIAELLRAYLAMPAPVIARCIGCDRPVRLLRDRVADLQRRTCRRTCVPDRVLSEDLLEVGTGQVRKQYTEYVRIAGLA